MHEMSLAVDLVRSVEAEADKAGLLKVTEIELLLGALQAVEPDLFAEAFKAASLGTRCQNSKLRLVNVNARANCGNCGQSYAPHWSDYQCPACGQAAPQITQGRDMILNAVSGER